jgi:hypothetical protein
VVLVASSQMLHESEAKEGWFDGVGCGTVEVEPNYDHLLVVIFLLSHRAILDFCFRYK